MSFKLSYVGKLYKSHLPAISNSHFIFDKSKPKDEDNSSEITSDNAAEIITQTAKVNHAAVTTEKTENALQSNSDCKENLNSETSENTLNLDSALNKNQSSDEENVSEIEINSDKKDVRIVLKKCSSKGLFVYAKLTSLMESDFAQNNRKIILTTTEISNRIGEGKIISGRMVKHQLDYFKEGLPHLFRMKSAHNKSYIYINLPENKDGFINIFALQNADGSYLKDTSASVVLSALLDKAAFNFRCGYGFTVEPSQLENLHRKFNLTKKTIENNLKTLKELKLIRIENESESDNQNKKKSILDCEIGFDFIIFEQFRKFINLEVTDKCSKIKEKRDKLLEAQKRREIPEPILQSNEQNINNTDNQNTVQTEDQSSPEYQAAILKSFDIFNKTPPESDNTYKFPTTSNYYRRLREENDRHLVEKRSSSLLGKSCTDVGKRSSPI
jgi:hypothetical protein